MQTPLLNVSLLFLHAFVENAIVSFFFKVFRTFVSLYRNFLFYFFVLDIRMTAIILWMLFELFDSTHDIPPQVLTDILDINAYPTNNSLVFRNVWFIK